jgi:hypothetical protein
MRVTRDAWSTRRTRDTRRATTHGLDSMVANPYQYGLIRHAFLHRFGYRSSPRLD